MANSNGSNTSTKPLGVFETPITTSEEARGPSDTALESLRRARANDLRKEQAKNIVIGSVLFASAVVLAARSMWRFFV